MRGTALYRALIQAGAEEETAKEVADGFDNNIKIINDRLSNLEIAVAEVRITNRILIVLVLAIFIKSFFV